MSDRKRTIQEQLGLTAFTTSFMSAYARAHARQQVKFDETCRRKNLDIQLAKKIGMQTPWSVIKLVEHVDNQEQLEEIARAWNVE